jgi:hypothetical protein
MEVNKLWLATLTKNQDDAGNGVGELNLTVNVDGEDVVDENFGFMTAEGWSTSIGPDSDALGAGQAGLSSEDSVLETNALTNSSIRLGIRDDDAWGPKHALLLGSTPRGVIALAMETDLDRWLSTDSSEGKLTMPMRLVSVGSSATLIRRVILLVYTESANSPTDDHIQLEITAGGSLVLQQEIPDTSQDDLEEYTANWYFLDVSVPFTRGDVLANGGIKVRILGKDAWIPTRLFVYGLDTAEGRPNEVIHLVSIPEWNLGTLSTQDNEGQPFVDLPVDGV